MSARNLLLKSPAALRRWNLPSALVSKNHRHRHLLHHSRNGLFGVSLSTSQRLTFATRASPADSYLLEVLKSEIDHELKQEADRKGAVKGSAGPFEVEDKPGTEEIMLKRTFGKEEISVACIVETRYPDAPEESMSEDEKDENDEESQEDENEETPSQGESEQVLHLNVTIKKEGQVPTLEMECVFTRGDTEVAIESIAFVTDGSAEETKDDDSGPQPYQGPPFEELDENMQRAFHDLLKARGLSAKVATYVLDYMSAKEHREYMRWLHNVETFFSS